MGLLDGKRSLVTGVLTDASLAFGVAQLAQDEGAEIVLTGAGRGLSLTERTARKLDPEPDGPRARRDRSRRTWQHGARRAPAERWGRVDGALHSIGFAPPVVPRRHVHGGRLGRRGGRHATSPPTRSRRWPTWSLPLMTDGGSIVGLDFDATVDVAGLRLDGRGQGRARVDLPLPGPRTSGPQGIRVNLVAAGPVKTMAAKSIPGFSKFEDVWDDAGPARLGRDGRRRRVAKACVALLSDWFPPTTGEIVHVDGGFHAIGA